MATMTISLPDPLKDWVEAKVRQGDYASTSDYMRDLVRRDRARHEQPDLTLDDLRRIVADSRASGTTDDSVADVLADARKVATARGVRPLTDG